MGSDEGRNKNGSSGGALINPAYDKITNTLEFIRHMGRQLALSKMFGCDSEAQGEVMALECLSRRMPPLTLAERYHLIFGKLSLKAEAMLADFRSKMGGDYKIVERTAERAAIELYLNGERLAMEFTWQDAQQEPFIYRGKDEEVVELLQQGEKGKPKLKLKAKYATPRARMQMLWARVVSDGVRAMAPEVTAGRYTPEEVADFTGANVALGYDDGEPEPAAAGGQTEVVAEVVKPVQPASKETITATTEADEADAPCSAEQVTAVLNLLQKLQLTEEQISNIKARRGVQAWRSMTAGQAAELIERLQAKAAELEEAAEASTLPPETVRVAVNRSPASQPQIDAAKAAIREIAPMDAKIAEKVQAKLKAAGLAKLADLTCSEIDALVKALTLRKLELFFELSLEGHAKN